MSAKTPVLYAFAISHYCEKARWALDHLGINYRLRIVAPGEHAQIAKKLELPSASVPYVSLGDVVIQGSADVVRWAEGYSSSGVDCLTPDVDACDEIERRIDSIVGVHVRRFYYSEALVEHPSSVRQIFLRDLSFVNKLKIGIAFNKIREIMIARMDLGEAQGEESKQIVDRELNWIDQLLSDGRKFLVNKQFSRADIAVASLLSPLSLPAEHPVYHRLQHPPKLAALMQSWNDRPAIRWSRDIYAQYRLTAG